MVSDELMRGRAIVCHISSEHASRPRPLTSLLRLISLLSLSS